MHHLLPGWLLVGVTTTPVLLSNETPDNCCPPLFPGVHMTPLFNSGGSKIYKNLHSYYNT